MHTSAPLSAAPAGTVLAVDDCPAMREIVCAVLERRGYQVHAVDNGLAALDAVRQARFDVIVLDIEMPGMDGLALARALRTAPDTAGAAIAMHSSMAEADVRCRFDAYDAYVRKGANVLALGEQVDRLARSRRLARPTPALASAPTSTPATGTQAAPALL